MFSIFSTITETKVPEGTKFIIFQPNKGQQIIIIKGKFGQFKIILEASLKFNQIPLNPYESKDQKLNPINEFSNLDNKGEVPHHRDTTVGHLAHNFNALSKSRGNNKFMTQKCNVAQTQHSKIFVQYNIDENKFLNFSKKHLIYNKKIKLLQEFSFLYSRNKSKSLHIDNKLKELWPLKNSVINGKEIEKEIKKTRYEVSIAQSIAYLQNHLFEETNLQYTKDINIRQANISPKILNFINQLKSIFIGLSQGYTINLELNGIGFYGNITTLDTMSPFFSKQKNLYSTKNMRDVSDIDKNIDARQRKLNISAVHIKNIKTKLNNRGEVLSHYKKMAGHLARNVLSDNKELSQETVKETLPFYWSKVPPTSLEVGGICGFPSLKESHNKKKYWKLDNTIKKNIYIKKPTVILPYTKHTSISFNKEISQKQKYILLNLGLSHNIVYYIPEHIITINCITSNLQSNVTNTLTIFGISEVTVNQIAAEIYKFKKPEPYKGKGIRYKGEKLFMKTEKKGSK